MDPNPPQPIDPAAILATITVLGLVVKAIIDGIRRQYPVEGIWVQLLAWALGSAMAFGLGIQGTEVLLEFVGATAGRTPHIVVDFIITGAAIAAGAGAIAELVGRAGPSANPPVVVEVNADGHRL
jgi:hypothetical protein